MSEFEYAERGLRVSEFKMNEFWTKFNSDRAQKRIDKAARAGLPWCTVCGAALAEIRQTVHIIAGGGLVLHPDDEDLYWERGGTGDGGDMGSWDVGPECARLIPKAFRRITSTTEGRWIAIKDREVQS